MKRLILYLLIIAPVAPSYAIDNAHFYRGNFFWGEPRFERDWLSTFDVSLGHGASLQGKDCNGKKTCLLSIYGPENLLVIGEGITLDNSEQDTILKNALAIPGRGSFGLVNIGGKFSITEGIIDYKQNFIKGFFSEMNLPIRSLKINNIGIRDLSPTDGTFPDSTNPTWVNLLLSLQSITEHHNLSIGPAKKTGIGDFTWLVGWTRNYQETTFLDYVDATVKTGVLFPTGKAKNENQAFSLPTGYNKHWGIPLSFDASFGIWEWLTLGMNAGVLVFFPKTKTMRMKTSFDQNGPIKLGLGTARVYPGHITHVGLYIKGDHFNEMFSYIIGYSYNRKHRDHLFSCDQSAFPNAIINTDSILASWVMNTLHVLFEADFAKEGNVCHPRLSFYINTPLGGRLIFDTTEGGADVGLDVTWDY